VVYLFLADARRWLLGPVRIAFAVFYWVIGSWLGVVLVPVGGCPMVVLGLVGGVFVLTMASGLRGRFGLVGGWD
jgi:hypothetical protein